VDWVTDGDVAVEAAESVTYDLVLLDLRLPSKDGLSILSQLRKRRHAVAVIILTARNGIDERVDGLDLGADDYLTKPFDMRELLARIRAIVRRQGASTSPLLTNGQVQLDPSTREAKTEGKACRLTAREFALLHALLMRPGTILSRSELEQRIYGWNEEVESNAVEFLIHSIRKKLGHGAIRNVRGLGWMVDRISSILCWMSSSIAELTAAYSPPMPRPVIIRNTAKLQKSQASALDLVSGQVFAGAQLRDGHAPRGDCSIFSGWGDQAQVRICHSPRAPAVATVLTPLGRIEVKGAGAMEVWHVIGRKRCDVSDRGV
jgi:two-component system OmpR family response regulator